MPKCSTEAFSPEQVLKEERQRELIATARAPLHRRTGAGGLRPLAWRGHLFLRRRRRNGDRCRGLLQRAGIDVDPTCPRPTEIVCPSTRRGDGLAFGQDAAYQRIGRRRAVTLATSAKELV